MERVCPQIVVELEWQQVLDSSQRPYSLPAKDGARINQETYGKPAVYRWVCRKPPATAPYVVYIGETDNLFLRLREYRNIHPSRSQAYRVASRLKEEAGKGGTVELQVLKFPVFFINGNMIEPSALSDPDRRKFMECLALIVQDRINCEVLNLSLKRFDRRIRRAQKSGVLLP